VTSLLRGICFQEKSSGIKRLDDERLEDKGEEKGEGDSLFVCGFIIARTTPPPRGREHRLKGKKAESLPNNARFFLLLHDEGTVLRQRHGNKGD
jgi:hypothetical protein